MPAPNGPQSSITATAAKNEFGRILDQVSLGGMVIITKHDVPKAVVISVEQFDALSRANSIKLDALSGEFDELLARMQASAVRAGMRSAFGRSPKQLGKAALAAARTRG